MNKSSMQKRIESFKQSEAAGNSVSNFRRDSLGVSFDGKFGTMRKAEDWVIYPTKADDKTFDIQSDKRWATIDKDTGEMWLSAPHSFANNYVLAMDKRSGKAQHITLEPEVLKQFLDAIGDRRITDHSLDKIAVSSDVTPAELRGESVKNEARYFATADWWKRFQDDYNDMYDGMGFEFKFDGPNKKTDIYSNGKMLGSISWKGKYKLLDEDGEWLYRSDAPEFRDFIYNLVKYHGDDMNKHYNGTVAKRSWEAYDSDSGYSRVSGPVADAYKLLDGYFCDDNGALTKDALDKVYLTYRNERDLYDRSKMKSVQSHSLAWDALLREINATLEWDDEYPHATKLSPMQVKTWFKLKNRDFKEDLKPLVDAIDAYRSKGESKKSEADGDKEVFTIDLYRIDADGEEEGLDDMAASKIYYSDEEAIKDAQGIVDGYKDDAGVVFAVVMGGEVEKPSGDIVGNPIDIYWASSSDKATTSDFREKARYAAYDNAMDYYAK